MLLDKQTGTMKPVEQHSSSHAYSQHGSYHTAWDIKVLLAQQHGSYGTRGQGGFGGMEKHGAYSSAQHGYYGSAHTGLLGPVQQSYASSQHGSYSSDNHGSHSLWVIMGLTVQGSMDHMVQLSIHRQLTTP